MSTLFLISIQAIYLVANLVIAKIEAHMFDIENYTINHTKYAIGTAIVSAFPLAALFYGWDWVFIWLWLAVSVMHFPVFSVSLNLFRLKAWDYRNTTDPNGSKWDKWLGKWYDEVLFGSVTIWVFLQFLIFKK
jgi:hypothetical protein